MEFLDDKLLLTSDLAVNLYNDCAKDMPIIDYHSHLIPQEIAEDKAFYNLTQLWLKGDHYKWRLMRNCGVEEEYITGDKSDKEKFRAFAATLPRCAGNSIYIWCHLELKRYFGITTPISPETADGIFDKTERMMKDGSFSARKLIKNSGVTALCTTDDPIDDLSWHKKIAASDFTVKVYPTFRPDKALNINKPTFRDYVRTLTGKKKPAVKDIKNALTERLDYFKSLGCFISDHALDNYIYLDCSDSEADEILEVAFTHEYLTAEETEKYKTYMMLFLAREYAKRNMAMQLHLCCSRDNNTGMFALLGPDTGFDSIENSRNPKKLAYFFDSLEREGALPKTVVYSLDPNDDKVINTIINCFQGGARGKIQHGSAWWFNDTEYGMKSHLKTLSEYSVIGNFIGMLTDSRSFTSYVRHDYFRRILCNHVAEIVNAGNYPADKNALKELIQGVCYENVKNYFGLKL